MLILKFNKQKYLKIKILCSEHGSNTQPSDFQSEAPPTELSPLINSKRPKGFVPTRGLLKSQMLLSNF